VRVHLKSREEIRLMRAAGLVAAEILEEMCQAAKPGTSTFDLDRIARAGIDRHGKRIEAAIVTALRGVTRPGVTPAEVDELTRTFTGLRAARPGMLVAEADALLADEIRRHTVRSAFLGYASPPYPAVVCTSINHVIVHGIPRKAEVLKDGDIIGIDFGIFMHGFCADTARTVPVGTVSPEKQRLVDTARESLDLAIQLCRLPNRLGDLGHAVQKHAESRGYSVVTQFVGHGTGRQMHEDPQVKNFGDPGTGKRLKAGLVIAVEPMVNAGTPDVEVLDDEWTAVTKDRSMSAHFEHTIAILEEGPWVLTDPKSESPHK